MLKHSKPELDKELEAPESQDTVASEQTMTSGLVKKDDTTATIKELLEKNLKWSQIIYEQNRKINHKLLWSTVANWLRLFIILVPFILAIIFLPSFIRNFKDRYFRWLEATSQTGSASSVESLINLLPLNAAERDRVKAMLK